MVAVFNKLKQFGFWGTLGGKFSVVCDLRFDYCNLNAQKWIPNIKIYLIKPKISQKQSKWTK